MCKITLIGDDHISRTCIITESETPVQILRYFNINPLTKIVYMNGTILSETQMCSPIRKTGSVYLSVRNKTVIRD